MCNAFNHPPGCNCGWGGGSGYGTLPGVGFEWTRPPRSYESFVNPNALCPVCMRKVFFYRSPHNGRVYFDRLGPPWPKHPCIDNSSQRQRVPSPTGSYSILMQCPPAQDGWVPLLPKAILRKFDTFYVEVSDKRIPGRFIPLALPLAGCSPMYWRPCESSGRPMIEISLLDLDRFDDIKIWTNAVPVGKSFAEAVQLRKELVELFKAK